MAALVQSFPQQSASVTMLQTRPSSASGSAPPHGHTSSRSAPMNRNVYSHTPTVSSYRGQTSSHAPVAPYAFTATPTLPKAPPHLKHENRTLSTPVHAFSRSTSEHRWPAPGAATTNPAQGSSPGSKDDSALAAGTTAANKQPDRYRRPHRRADTAGPTANNGMGAGSAAPSGSGMVTVGHLYSQVVKGAAPPPRPAQAHGPPPAPQPAPTGLRSSRTMGSVDDMNLHRQSGSEQAKRYRRRSISSIDAHEFKGLTDDRAGPAVSPPPPAGQGPVAREPAAPRPTSSRGRSDSASSLHSSRSTSSHPPTRDPALSPLTANPVSTNSTSPSKQSANVPPRGSSEASKRMNSPSPLSQPMSMSPEMASSQSFAPNKAPEPLATPVASHVPDSPAAAQLAALNDKDAKKKGKSRLRRAFSFGSAAELRKASAENNLNNNAAAAATATATATAASGERAKLRKERYQDEREAEQEAIARKQEEGGIGEGIYSGQGNFYTGSTDNLSISSTASSASVMIRKMGKGMKKSTRSLVGLFRPKSMIGATSVDVSAPEPSVGQVSMVTVEAEREKVNVNLNPHDQAGGGTGFPKLERNSVEAVEARAASRDGGSGDSINSRRSIVGGERERAEVLAAVKKGILKRSATDSGNSSPVSRPVDANPSSNANSKTPDFHLPAIPHFSDTPRSSAPSTPEDDRPAAQLGHRRTDSVTIEGEDYFMSLPRFTMGESKSAPNTPQSMARNISFSPRIQFHDTWPSGEYDRRGEIATCNRLTPTLAQQIKEELNSFKMEMEVHEQSKVYTHFF